eukprot:3355_1
MNDKLKSMAASWCDEDFGKDEFDPQVLIGNLTNGLFPTEEITNSSRNNFDPIPLQHAFDDAMVLLNKLRDQADDRISELSHEMHEAEEAHRGKLKKFDHSLGDIFAKFHGLDQRISKVVHTAVRTGDRLELVDQRKQRTVHGEEMIRHFLSFRASRTAGATDKKSFDRILRKNKGRMNTYEATAVVQELQRISADLRIPETEQVEKLIARKSEELEAQLLVDFERATGDVKRMKMAAAALLNFHGASVTKRFVFRVSERINFSTYDTHSLSAFQTSISTFFKEVSSVWAEQCRTINKVFPDRFAVMKMLLERIFEEKILAFVERALEDCGRSVANYLEVLDVTYSATKSLIEDMKRPIQLLREKEQSSTPFDLNLEDIMDTSLIARFRNGYMNKECRALRDLIKREIDATFVVVTADTDDLGEQSTSAGKTKSPWNRWKRKSSGRAEAQKWLDGVLQDDLVKRLTVASATAMRRCSQMSDPNELAVNVRQLFSILLSALSTEYFPTILDSAAEQLPESDPKTEPDLFFLKIVKSLNFSVQKLEEHFNADVLPRMVSNNKVQALLIAEKREIIRSVEQNILAGMEKCVNSISHFCGRILSSEQKKPDFRPKDGNILPEYDTCTRACRKSTSYLDSVKECAIDSLDGTNLDVLMKVVGNKFYSTLMAHLQKYSISITGSLLLMQDAKIYQSTMRGFRNSSVDEKFDTLRHLINALAVPPDDIRILVAQDAKLSKIGAQTLRSFLKLRADFRTAKVELLL